MAGWCIKEDMDCDWNEERKENNNEANEGNEEEVAAQGVDEVGDEASDGGGVAQANRETVRDFWARQRRANRMDPRMWQRNTYQNRQREEKKEDTAFTSM